MNIQDILNALDLGEDKDWEFKSARGGLPGSLWETYSAMANTDGGCIVLGIKEKDDGAFEVQGLDDPAKTERDFWNLVNHRQKISLNLLTNNDVRIEPINDRPVLVVQIPRATRTQRPVFVGQNPLDGTYRRYNEGDYKCSKNEVGRMLADQAEEPADCLILENFHIDDLDEPSIQQYRNRFSARTPQHPWLAEDLTGLLEKLGGWRRDRNSGMEGLTVAGLLMFGKDEAIRDPAAVPQYHLDYREKLSDDPEVRWTDRLTIDGTWVGNLFQFYQKVIGRLTSDLKIPFQMQPDLFRKDDTIVHEAIREALVNALIHADFRGQGGVVIEKYRDRFEMSNPGTLLLSFDQLLQGGVSECRNKTIQTMFSLLGYGEKAGSGFAKIRQGWASQQWRFPKVQETNRPDRVRIVMPMVGLLPEDSVERLRTRFGPDVEMLGPVEVQALVTAETEGSVDNSRLREICDEHPADLSKLLQGLVAKGLLMQKGQRRWSFYELLPASASHSGDRTPHITDRTPHITDGNSTHNGHATPHIAAEHDPQLVERARTAREKRRLPPAEMEHLILDLCRTRFLTPRQIGLLVDRNPQGLQERFLRPMAKSGELTLLHPDEPNHRDQAYKTAADGKEAAE